MKTPPVDPIAEPTGWGLLIDGLVHDVPEDTKNPARGLLTWCGIPLVGRTAAAWECIPMATTTCVQCVARQP